MKVKRTYSQMGQFDAVASHYLAQNGFWDPQTKKFADKKDSTKLVENIKSILKQWGEEAQGLNEKIGDIDLDHCAVDETTKVILRDEKGGLQFTRDGIKARNVAIKALFEQEIEIHSRITTDVPCPEGEEYEIFLGLVFPELVAQE